MKPKKQRQTRRGGAGAESHRPGRVPAQTWSPAGGTTAFCYFIQHEMVQKVDPLRSELITGPLIHLPHSSVLHIQEQDIDPPPSVTSALQQQEEEEEAHLNAPCIPDEAAVPGCSSLSQPAPERPCRPSAGPSGTHGAVTCRNSAPLCFHPWSLLLIHDSSRQSSYCRHTDSFI